MEKMKALPATGRSLVRHFTTVLLIAGLLAGWPATSGSHVEVGPVGPQQGPLPDLLGKILGSVRVRKTPQGVASSITFKVLVGNTGPAAAQGSLTVKPFLIPVDRKGVAQGDGFVLPTQAYDVNLPASALYSLTTLQYTAPLHNLPDSLYKLGVVLDSKNLIAESNELNNVTHLARAGRFMAAVGSPPDEPLDFTTEIQGPIISEYGGASHTLRTILTPTDPQADPDELSGGRDEDLWARFMLIDTARGHVYTLPYEEGYEGEPFVEFEKQFYALFWDKEHNVEGRQIYVDYYYQEPMLDKIPPGAYSFASLIDSHDLFGEANEQNNLDLHPFILSPIEWDEYPNLWFVANAADPSSLYMYGDLDFHNNLTADLPWRASVVSANGKWLLDPQDGEIYADDYDYTSLEIEAPPQEDRKYTATVKIAASQYRNYPLTAEAKLFVHGARAPVLNVLPEVLNIETPQDVHPPKQQFVISNTGTKELEWEVRSEEHWITVFPLTGKTPPGGTSVINIVIHPEGLDPWMHEGYVLVYSSAQNEPAEVEVCLNVV